MTNDRHELLARTLIRHEVSLYYIFFDERPAGAEPVQRRLHKGFDVSLFGSPVNGELHLDGGNKYMHSTLEDLKTLASQVLSIDTNGSEVEVIPLEDSVAMSPARNYKAEAALLIRITRGGSLDQPAGPHEEQVLHAVIENLEALREARNK